MYFFFPLLFLEGCVYVFSDIAMSRPLPFCCFPPLFSFFFLITIIAVTFFFFVRTFFMSFFCCCCCRFIFHCNAGSFDSGQIVPVARTHTHAYIDAHSASMYTEKKKKVNPTNLALSHTHKRTQKIDMLLSLSH